MERYYPIISVAEAIQSTAITTDTASLWQRYSGIKLRYAYKEFYAPSVLVSSVYRQTSWDNHKHLSWTFKKFFQHAVQR